MPDAPRLLGRPLDAQSALARAAQAAALADPVRVRVLSAMASSPDTLRSPASLALALGIGADEATESLKALRKAGLVAEAEHTGMELTADAWVRFGRLLVDTGSPSGDGDQADVSTVSSDSAPLPGMVSQITDDLAYRFHSHFSRETVARYVRESYVLLSERANITRFLPSLTRRFATDRLSALATAEGRTLRGTPEVLFVCVQNAGRSQMAAAMLAALVGDRVHVRTAGSSPAAAVHPMIIDALDEIAIPLAEAYPKPLTDEVVKAADYVITMGCGDACPIYPGRRYMDWTLEDPVGKSIEEVRSIRDDILTRIRALIREMGVGRQTSR